MSLEAFELEDYLGSNRVIIRIGKHKYVGSRSLPGSLVGKIGGVSFGKSKVVAKCDNRNVYAQDSRTVGIKVGYVKTTTGGFLEVKDGIAPILLVIIALLVFLLVFIYSNGINNYGEKDNPSSSEVSSNVYSDPVGPEDDIGDGEISPNLPDDVIKKKMNDAIENSANSVIYNRTPRVKDGKMHILYALPRKSKYNARLSVYIGDTKVYQSSILKPGQNIQEATLFNMDKIDKNSTKGYILIEQLDKNNELVIPIQGAITTKIYD